MVDVYKYFITISNGVLCAISVNCSRFTGRLVPIMDTTGTIARQEYSMICPFERGGEGSAPANVLFYAAAGLYHWTQLFQKI